MGDPTVALVTGANRGIGLGWVRRLVARGRPVIAGCRARSEELDALGAEVLDGFDVTAPAAASSVAAELGGRRIDLLIHNAGLFIKDEFDNLDANYLRQQWEVNALGPLMLTRGLEAHLAPGGRVVLMSSDLASIERTTGSHYGYRMSKAALNMAGRILANDLARHDVVVIVLSPGRVRTAMSGHRGDAEPDEAAEQLLQLVTRASPADTGRFVGRDGHAIPW